MGNIRLEEAGRAMQHEKRGSKYQEANSGYNLD
jgi:hypothetical protein